MSRSTQWSTGLTKYGTLTASIAHSGAVTPIRPLLADHIGFDTFPIHPDSEELTELVREYTQFPLLHGNELAFFDSADCA